MLKAGNITVLDVADTLMNDFPAYFHTREVQRNSGEKYFRAIRTGYARKHLKRG